MKIEKRKFPRVDFEIQASFEVLGQMRTDHRCENVSMSGLFLWTDDPLPVGTQGNLLIMLECGEERIEVRAECNVSRVVKPEDGGDPGMGLEYISIDSDSSFALYNIVKYQGGLLQSDKEKGDL